MNVNIKWVGKDDKIKRLERLRVNGVKAELDKVKDVDAEVKKLEKNTTASKELGKIQAKIIETAKDINTLIKEKLEFITPNGDDVNTPVDGVTFSGFKGKGGKDKATAFKTNEKLDDNLNKWLKDLHDGGLDNLYEIEWKGTKYKTIENIGVERIGYEVGYWLAQIDHADFEAKVNAVSDLTIFGPVTKTDLINFHQNLVDYVKDGTSSEKMELDSVTKNGKVIKFHEYKWGGKPNTFNFNVLFRFMEAFAPYTQLSGDKAFYKNWSTVGRAADDLDWYIWKARDTILDQTTREQLVKNHAAPAIFKDKNYKAYWDDDNKGTNIKLEPGLKGIIDLYYAAFSSPDNRRKLAFAVNGEYNPTTTSVVGTAIAKNPIIKIMGDATIAGSYSYDSAVAKDEDGNFKKVWCLEDPQDTVTAMDLRLVSLKAEKDLLEKEKMPAQNKLVNEQQEKIDAERKKLEVADKAIDDLVKVRKDEKIKEVTDMKLSTWSNDDWKNPENILRATGAKQALLDIRWLDGDGQDKGGFKDEKGKTPHASDCQDALELINSKQKDITTWNLVIKQHFESKGSDLNSRIAAFKGDAKIGLEVLRDAFEQLGEAAIVKAIDAELAKEAPQPLPSDKIKIDQLRTALGAKDDASETDLKLNDWKTILSNTGSGNTFKSDKEIKELIDKTGKNEPDADKNKDDSRWKKFQKHLAEHPYLSAKIAEGANQWDEFIKKEPKVIIGTILYFEYEDKDDPFRTQVKNDMEAAKTSALGTDGKKALADGETWDSTQQKDITKFLFRRAIGKELVKVKNVNSDDPSKKPDTPGDEKGNNEHSWWKFGEGNYWRPALSYGLIVLAVLGVTAVIFWKSIVGWWNGPAEEAGGSDEEGSDTEDEEKE